MPDTLTATEYDSVLQGFSWCFVEAVFLFTSEIKGSSAYMADKFNGVPFILTVRAKDIICRLIIGTWMSLTEPSKVQTDFQQLTQQINGKSGRDNTEKDRNRGRQGEGVLLAFLRWHKAGRCGKPQLLHSLWSENIKSTTSFDLQTWIRLSASEKNSTALETIFPNYLPITPTLFLPLSLLPSIPPTLTILSLISKWDGD